DSQVDRASVDLFEDVAGALKYHLGGSGGQPAHASAVLAWIASIDAQPALAQETQRVVFPAFRRQRDTQRAHWTIRWMVPRSSPRATVVSARERMSRTTAVPSSRSRSPTITTQSMPARSA